MSAAAPTRPAAPQTGEARPAALHAPHSAHATHSMEALQSGLIDALRACIDTAGNVSDPHSEKRAPSDHYAHCSLALALACDARGGSSAWQQAMLPLRAWGDLPVEQIGHLPFNRLLLGQLHARGRHLDAPADDLQRIDAARARCVLRDDYPSNNWRLLAQTCHLLESDPGSEAEQRHRKAFCKQLSQWTTPAGGFVDFPARFPTGARVATPFAYHLKAIFLTALVARLRPDPDVFAQLRRLLHWLAQGWDPTGHAGGPGRSTHALFGDACLIASLILLGFEDPEPTTVHTPENPANVARATTGGIASPPLGAIVHRLCRQLRSDGLLWLNPGGPTNRDAAWDNYMYLSVYNAWTAALIGLCTTLGPIPQARLREHGIDRDTFAGPTATAAADTLYLDEQAGLAFVRTALRSTDGAPAHALGNTLPDACAVLLFGTRGQCPQALSRDEVELRYAGGVPFHLAHPELGPLLPPPLRVPRVQLAKRPWRAGWTPVFEHRGMLYGLTDFDEVRVELTDGALHVRLRGEPLALCRAQPRGPLARVVAALDWRLFDGRIGRARNERRHRLDGVQGTLVWRIDLAGARIDYQLELRTDRSVRDCRYLNPLGHALVGVLAPSPIGIGHAFPSSISNAFACCAEAFDLSPGEYCYRLRATHDEGCWTVTSPDLSAATATAAGNQRAF